MVDGRPATTSPAARTCSAGSPSRCRSPRRSSSVSPRARLCSRTPPCSPTPGRSEAGAGARAGHADRRGAGEAGASRTRVGGRYDGPHGPALVVAVHAPAVDGRATEAARRALAEALGSGRPRCAAGRRGQPGQALPRRPPGPSWPSAAPAARRIGRVTTPGRGTVTPGLDLALLLGAAVLLVAVGAVRLSTRLGLPSLLVYLALGVALGEAGLGIRFDDAELTQALGFCALVVILAEGGLTTRWSDACGRCSGSAAALATVGVVVSIAVVGVRRAPAARAGLAAGAALRRGALLDRRGGGLLRAAPAAAAAPAGGHAGGRVGHQRRAGGAAGRAAVPRPAPARTRGGTSVAAGRLRAGGRRGDRAGRRARRPLGAAPGRAARRPGCTRSPWSGSPCWRTPPARSLHASRLPRRLRGRAGAGQRPAAAPAGHPRLRRRAGLAGPDRAVRAARPAGLAAAGWPRRCCRRWSSGWPWCCWPGRCRCWSSRAAVPGRAWREQAFLSWAGLRGAVPIVLATIPLSAGVPGAERLFDVGLRAGGGLHPAAGRHAGAGRPAAAGDRAGRGRPRSTWRPRRWSGCGPTCCSWRCRRARGWPACTSRAAAAGRGVGDPGAARRGGFRARRRTPG